MLFVLDDNIVDEGRHTCRLLFKLHSVSECLHSVSTTTLYPIAFKQTSLIATTATLLLEAFLPLPISAS